MNPQAAPTTPKNLVSKLCDIMKTVERIPKNGHNDFHNYDYVREADVADSIRKELVAHNVFLSSSMVSSDYKVILNDKGKQSILTGVTMRYTFRDGDSSEVIEFDMGGQGSDAMDKGIYKAITGCTKYALMKTFLIPTGDDPEAEGSESDKPLTTTDMNGNSKPLPPKPVVAPKPVQPIAPRPTPVASNKESVFIESIDKRQSQKGDAFLIITTNNGQRYSVWDTTFFPAAQANIGRTLTLGVKVDAKGYKSIISGLEPIEEEA